MSENPPKKSKENSDAAITKVSTPGGTAYIQTERSCVIPESRLEHLESLIDRARKYEVKPNKWNWKQTICSVSGTVFITILATAISIWTGQMEITNTAGVLIYAVFIASGVITLISFIYCISEQNEKLNNQESFLSEVHDILQRMRGSFSSGG